MSTDRPAAETQLQALTDAAAALARGSNLDASLDGIMAAAAAATGAGVGVLFLRDPDRPDLQMTAVVGMSVDELAWLEAAVADPNHPIAAAARDVAAVFGRDDTTSDGMAYVAADIPLVVVRNGLDLPLGVVSFGWPAPRTLDEHDERIVRAAADLLAVAADRAQLASLSAERAEWYERMAHTDPLTGLANRRTFERVLELELARAGRQGGEVSVALFDIDDFSATNASAGHETGDDVLRKVAAVLAESVRLVDMVARFGGDEFVLVAPGSAGLTVARRVVEGIAALDPVEGRTITVSAGIARFPNEGLTGDELVTAAEGAVASARSAGPGSIAEAVARTV